MLKNLGMLASVLTVLLITFGCQTNEKLKSKVDYSTNYVEQVNFILITPDNAESFHNLLVNTFELTEAWPFNKYYGVEVGGVLAGNVTFDTTQTEIDDYHGISGIGFLPATDFNSLKSGLEDKGLIGESTQDSIFTNPETTNKIVIEFKE